MNARQKKMAAAAVVLAIAVPAIGFAAANTSTGSTVVGKAMSQMRAGSGSSFGEGRGMRGGMKGGMMGAEAGMLTNENVRTALAASGVTLPTADEAKAYHEKMKAAREAEQALPDADKTALKTMRDATREKVQTIHEESAKAEREYLRSKGVALPSEDEISKMSETMKKAAEVLRAQRPNMGQDNENGMRGEGRGHGRGMKGGMGFGQMGANQDAPAETEATE